MPIFQLGALTQPKPREGATYALEGSQNSQYGSKFPKPDLNREEKQLTSRYPNLPVKSSAFTPMLFMLSLVTVSHKYLSHARLKCNI